MCTTFSKETDIFETSLILPLFFLQYYGTILDQRCCQLLRKTERIDRMVYVSCDASAAMKSFIDLCRATSNGYGGRPFLPTKALAVDLFPDTPHCELVIVLERYVEDKSDL